VIKFLVFSDFHYKKGMYAVVEIDDECNVRVTGSKTAWMYGVEPSRLYENCRPEITGFEVIKNKTAEK